MDVSQYLEVFIDETKEHLQSLSDQIMILEQEPENNDCVNEIFRAAHSMKGMAGTMGYKRMQTLTHDMENVFSEVRNGNIKVDPPMIDVLFQCLDALEEYLDIIQNTSDEGTNENEPIIKALNEILTGGGGGGDAAAAPAAAPAAAAPAAEAAAPAADAGSGGSPDELWRQLPLGDAEKNIIKEAAAQSRTAYGFTVYIQENCILKAARAFLVIKAMEDFGDLIVCNPSTQEIEDDKFENFFSVVVVTDAKYEQLYQAAIEVSEIEKVVGGEYGPDGTPVGGSAPAAAAPAAEPAPAAAAPAAAAPAAPAETKPAAPAAAAKNAPAKADPKKPAAGKPVAGRTVRVDIEKLDSLMNLVSELIIAKNSIVSITENAGEINGNSSFNEQIEYLESVTTNLHESVMKVRMVPIESVVQKFPRMIRDLQKKLGKKMELYMTGEETELDRTVVDEIGDPLMHLLRNAADHGLESAEVRAERGKPEEGTIRLDAYQDGNNVIIEVSDDGGGIDAESVRNKAIERGTITQEQADSMSEKEIVDLLFLPAFSTAKEVTDVSGRGVGLDVVKSKIESLSGEVDVKTKYGEGSTWSIRLPLTLAIIQALMVVVGGEKYAISLGSIVTIEDITSKDIGYVQAREVINLRGTVIPLIRLDDMLDIPDRKEKNEDLVVVIVRKGDKQAGLVVDELMGQQEIVIKSLGNYINKCKFISGATILGNGEVALILDTNAMM